MIGGSGVIWRWVVTRTVEFESHKVCLEEGCLESGEVKGFRPWLRVGDRSSAEEGEGGVIGSVVTPVTRRRSNSRRSETWG